MVADSIGRFIVCCLLSVLFSVACRAENAPATQVPPQLSLVQAVRLGIANNPQLKRAHVNYQTAQADVNIARDLQSTNIFAGLSQAAVGSQPSETSARVGARLAWERSAGDSLTAVVVPASTSSLTSNLQVQYRRPLARESGKTSNTNIRILTSQLSLSREELQLYIARQDTALAVISAYFNALQAREQIDISRSDLEIAKETARIAKRRLEEGLVAELELSRAENQVARSEDELIGRQQRYRNALDSLLLAMGLKVGQSFELVTDASVQNPGLDIDALVSEALENRKELKIAQIGLERQKLEQSVSSDQLRHALDLVGSYTRAGITTGAFSASSYWTAGLDYSIPLGSVSRQERKKSADRELNQLLSEQEFQNERIKNEVLTQYRAVMAASDSLKISQDNLKVAEDGLRLAQRMVEEGLALNREVLEAQQSLKVTRLNLLSGQIEYYLALMNLKRAVGRDIAQEMAN